MVFLIVVIGIAALWGAREAANAIGRVVRLFGAILIAGALLVLIGSIPLAIAEWYTGELFLPRSVEAEAAARIAQRNRQYQDLIANQR